MLDMPESTIIGQLDALCVGAIQSDLLGTVSGSVEFGDDVPGQIRQAVGGVAYRVAKALHELGIRTALCSVVGQDSVGAWLRKQAVSSGLASCEFLSARGHASGAYLAIESDRELVAAVADCIAIESFGRELLEMADRRFAAARFANSVRRLVVDTNLLPEDLSSIAAGGVFGDAELYVVVASNHKLDGVRSFAGRGQTTIYLNLSEANRLISGNVGCLTAVEAAARLRDQGFERVVVTNGARTAADCGGDGSYAVTPRSVGLLQVTGAGDRLAARHIAGSIAGDNGHDALLAACEFAIRGRS